MDRTYSVEYFRKKEESGESTKKVSPLFVRNIILRSNVYGTNIEMHVTNK